MPRDGAGTYILPAGNPVITGTTISIDWANTTVNDIATALTNSLSVDGSVTAGKLATNSITTIKITDGSVTNAKLASGAVTADKLAANAVTTDKIADGAVTASKLFNGAATVTGTIIPFARNTPPSGWLKCNGASVNRTTYATLFAAIGTTFGVGDGSTTFNLPDMRGEFIRGWDNGRGVDTGRVFGSAQSSAVGSHNHTASSGTNSVGHTHAVSITSGSNSADHTHAVSITSGGDSVSHTHSFSATTSSDGAHSHTWNAVQGGFSSRSSNDPVKSNGTQDGTHTTSSAGAHTHPVSGTSDANSVTHTHLVTGTSNSHSTTHTHLFSTTSASESATHTHTVTVDSTGGAESRPRNIALLYCIKT